MFTNSESLMVALLIISILIDGVVSFNMSQRYLFQGQLAVAIIEKQDISRAITQVAPFTPLAAYSYKATTMARAEDRNKFTINLRIRGIDYSDKMAQVWITVRNQTVAYNINPIALLDPQDDGDGIIHIPVTFPQGVVSPGDEYTACIKILVHSDNFGDTFSCQKGIVNLMSASQSISQMLANNMTNRLNQTQVQPYRALLGD